MGGEVWEDVHVPQGGVHDPREQRVRGHEERRPPLTQTDLGQAGLSPLNVLREEGEDLLVIFGRALQRSQGQDRSGVVILRRTFLNHARMPIVTKRSTRWIGEVTSRYGGRVHEDKERRDESWMRVADKLVLVALTRPRLFPIRQFSDGT